jgi:hypothetical protein
MPGQVLQGSSGSLEVIGSRFCQMVAMSKSEVERGTEWIEIDVSWKLSVAGSSTKAQPNDHALPESVLLPRAQRSEPEDDVTSFAVTNVG